MFYEAIQKIKLARFYGPRCSNWRCCSTIQFTIELLLKPAHSIFVECSIYLYLLYSSVCE